MNIQSLFGYGLAAALFFFVSACGGGTEEHAQQDAAMPPAQEETAAAPSQDLIAEGKTLFAGKGTCFTCHGPDGAGSQIGPDLTDDTWLNLTPPITRDQVTELVKSGVPEPKQYPAPMPPLGAQLDEDELQAVSAYIVSLSQ
jgi:mono/diheme cytochrome c family protein